MSATSTETGKRGLEAFLNIARLCAEANERLTTAQKRELIHSLPFGETAFSKFVPDRADTRLYAPDIQRAARRHTTRRLCRDVAHG